jgi:indolepyruvate ferredoxin oxidoreductase
MAQPATSVALDDKYTLRTGTAFMTGVQALVRLPLEQARRDRDAGLRTGTLISGYPGSPLGGYDLELQRASSRFGALDIHLVPGVNEELAAAAVWGTQMLSLFGSSEFDGATGIWYGKSPGVDRSLDVFRHGNFGGGVANSGMLALAGDDPGAKSSTIPNQSEFDFIACAMPVLTPATVREFLTLGLHGIAMSRLTGLWPAMKCPTDICDGGAVVDVSADDPRLLLPELDGFVKPAVFQWGYARALELERHIFEERLPAALEYGRVNELNVITQSGSRDRLGLVAAGKTYRDLAQALADLGYGARELEDAGIRLLKVGMVYPLDPEILVRFADGLEEIVVVEEKRELVERELLAALARTGSRPRVLGKHGEHGEHLFPQHGELNADIVAERIAPRLERLGRTPPPFARRVAEIAEIRARSSAEFARRVPNYCSGCPHSRSTVAIEGEVVGGGIGCHSIAALTTQPERQVVYLAPMGAEGAPWIGGAPFVSTEHIFQNVGDGTFFHSGSQALRATVAAGVNITFKLLYNRHIAMTGGQQPEGGHDLVKLANYLDAEGVTRTIIVSEQPELLRGAPLPSNTRVYERQKYEQAVRELGAESGTTVLVFDQECAAEKRRARKRGRLPEPEKYIVINEEVCEGCGDCGDVSNCMSLAPVETELGRKTQIHQASCNKDYSCVRGDCPSFVTVHSHEGLKRPAIPELAADRVPEPATTVDADHGYRVFMPGIGGTGVITVSQVLAYAALIEGKQAHILGQTGLAQKGGSVISSLTLFSGPEPAFASNRIGAGQADLVLAFDPVGLVAPNNADRMSPERTVVIADRTVQPTAEAVQHVEFAMPSNAELQAEVDHVSRRDANRWIDAGKIAEQLFTDPALTNVFVLGFAYQAGLIPISASAIEQAIALNGAAVSRNLQAFRYGRLQLHEPESVARLLSAETLDYTTMRSRYVARLGRRAAAYEALLHRCEDFSDDSLRMLALRIGELIEYQDVSYATTYVDRVLVVRARESELTPESEELTRAVIRFLYKLMAYKDEYEVARLLLKSRAAADIEAMFHDGAKRSFNLHPPLLRARGLKKKLELGAWFRPVLATLIPLRRLRGTAFDPFGRAEVRRTERELIGWYDSLLDTLLASLTPEKHRLAVQLASAPDRIRGYEDIKLASVKRVRATVERRLGEYLRREDDVDLPGAMNADGERHLDVAAAARPGNDRD